MKSVLYCLAVVVVVLLAGSVKATPTVVSLTPYADSDVRWTSDPADSDYAKGDRTSLYINYVTGKNDEAKAYIRYQLPSDFGSAVSATFSITRVVVDAWNMDYNVYGLKDSAAGNDWQDLNHGIYTGPPSAGITWNNAPGNDKTSGNGFNSDATGALGTFSTVGYRNDGTNYGTYSVSTTDLVSFVNTDTDKSITLMISRLGDSSSGAEFASKENGTYAAPTLVLTYNSTPEPATMALLGLGVFGLRKLRK